MPIFQRICFFERTLEAYPDKPLVYVCFLDLEGSCDNFVYKTNNHLSKKMDSVSTYNGTQMSIKTKIAM